MLPPAHADWLTHDIRDGLAEVACRVTIQIRDSVSQIANTYLGERKVALVPKNVPHLLIFQ